MCDKILKLKLRPSFSQTIYVFHKFFFLPFLNRLKCVSRIPFLVSLKIEYFKSWENFTIKKFGQ